MKNDAIYNAYYGITAGRFYSAEQKERILKLVASAGGMKIFGVEFVKMLKTTQYIDSLELENEIDCKNYLLLLSFCEEACSDKQTACRALLRGYESSPVYLSSWDWQKNIMDTSDEYSFERAFYEYANGNHDNAIREFEGLSDKGSIPSMKYLAQIFYDSQKYYEAFYYIEMVKKSYRDNLHCKEDEHLLFLVPDILNHLSSDEINEIENTIRNKKVSGNGTSGKRHIGFSSQL